MYSKGIRWIDDCRIPFVDEGDKQKGKIHDAGGNGEGKYNWNTIIKKSGNEYRVSQGRFPANLLVSDDMLNDGIKPNKGHRSKSKVSGYGEFGGGKSEYHGIGEYMNVDSTSRYYDIDKWFNNLIDV
jgi:hypothetical protein